MCETERVRLLLVANYPVVCAGLRHMLGRSDSVEVLGEVHSTAEAVAVVRQNAPDVVLVDADGTEVSLSGIGAIARACESRILVFTAITDPGMCVRAIELGASGIVSKSCPEDQLVRAVLKVNAGEIWLDRAQTARVLSHAMHKGRDPELAKIESLTKREREVVAKVGEGLKNFVIAERLFISEATVRNHLTSILAKLELSDRFELAVYAFRHRLVRSPDPSTVYREEPLSDRRSETASG